MRACVITVALVSSQAASTIARDPEPLPGVDRVTAGDAHTCAEWRYGASCWGDNAQGKLGNGTVAGVLLAPQAPPMIAPDALLAPPTPAGRPFAGLDAGPSRTCAIATGDSGTVAGQAWCWGGEGGLGRVSGFGDPWSDVAPGVVYQGPPGDLEGDAAYGTAPLEPVYAIAVAELRTCALVGSPWDGSGGEVWCWDTYGSQDDLLAHPLAGLDGMATTRMVSIDAAFDRFCGIDTGGKVWCWDDRSSEPPAMVAGIADARAIAVGGEHTCAQVRDGSVWCWGANDRGQLGDSSEGSRAAPVRVAGLDETLPADPGDETSYAFPWWRTRRILAAGRSHTCVLRDEPISASEYEFERSSAVFCWGANDRGQLGDGSRDDRPTAVRVVDLDPGVGVFDLALGGAHSCVVTGEQVETTSPDPTFAGAYFGRALRCWGANAHGQLGTGDTNDRTRPALVVMTDGPRLAHEPS